MPIGQMLAVATITGARRASDQTQERARSHQSQANLAADRSLAYTRFMHPGALRGMGTQEKLPMSTDTTVSPLRQRMIEDMAARKLGPHTQRSHVYSCKRFAAFLKRSPDTATADDIRRFQMHLAETGISICNRNRIMTGVRFLFRVTLRRHDLAAEIYHLKEPEKLPLIMSSDEARRLLAMARNIKVRVILALGYGCGLRAGEIVRLKVGNIDSEQMIIRIEQSKGRKDRNVMLTEEMLPLLREWWKVRPTRYDANVPVRQRWLFPGRRVGKHLTTRQ